jgi:predicted ATPase
MTDAELAEFVTLRIGSGEAARGDQAVVPFVRSPWRDLAIDYGHRVLDQFYVDPQGVEGNVRVKCPVCREGWATFCTLECGPLGDGLWCSRGCDDADVLAAVELVIAMVPPRCTSRDIDRFGHAGSCLDCQGHKRGLSEVARELHLRFRAGQGVALDSAEDSMVVSGDFALDVPSVSPLWGTAEAPLMAKGQPTMLAGPDGTGKSTVISQYVKTRLRLAGWPTTMWGLEVPPLYPDLGALILTADRPQQFIELFARGLNESHRDELRRRVHFHRGPTPHALATAAGQRWLLGLVEKHSAGIVVLDSHKDFATQEDLRAIAGLNSVIQRLEAAGVQVIVASHTNKMSRVGWLKLEDISGYREIFSGMGSVLLLNGGAGSTLINVSHGKPVRGVLPPYRIAHDFSTGISERQDGIVPAGAGDLAEGRMPVDRLENIVGEFMRAQPGMFALSMDLQKFLDDRNLSSGNLSRDLGDLRKAGRMTWNKSTKTETSGWTWTDD